MPNRNLDGIYFRVKRGDKYENICWTDLTRDERDLLSQNRTLEWWQILAEHLTNVIQNMGNDFDIYGGEW